MTLAFRREIEAALEPSAHAPLARAVLEGRAGPCFLVGRNSDAARLAPSVRAAGLVDDGAPPGTTWNGLPVIGSAEIPDGAVVVNASSSIRPVDVVRRFAGRAGVNLLGLADLVSEGDGAITLPDFAVEQRADWAAHAPEWCELHDRMSDAESRRTLLDVLRFRLTADPAYMAGYEVRIEEQYFEPFLGLAGEVFVDAGGFDGDTAEAFRRHDPGYRAIHLFEPSPANMEKARKRLAGLRDVQFHTVGLSDVAGELSFDPDAGSASAIGGPGGQRIPVAPLDACLEGPVSLIKMDLEGWETRALEGARRLISEGRPKLALAVYHRASDFRDIARFALSMHADYRVHLRHYTQGWSETVMFFV
ncbi:MAG: FkbM family methyltransferase [Phenylobacterium sp.]